MHFWLHGVIHYSTCIQPPLRFTLSLFPFLLPSLLSYFFLPSPSPSLFLPFALQLFLSLTALLSPPLLPSPPPLPSLLSPPPPLPFRGLVLIRGKSSDGTGADSNGSGKVLHSVLACVSPFSHSSIVLFVHAFKLFIPKFVREVVLHIKDYSFLFLLSLSRNIMVISIVRICV